MADDLLRDMSSLMAPFGPHASLMSASRQRTNPLTREGLAAQSSDYVCRSNYLNERK
jgi:hypothetical protein